jgi:hypothetical protein
MFLRMNRRIPRLESAGVSHGWNGLGFAIKTLPVKVFKSIIETSIAGPLLNQENGPAVQSSEGHR